MLRSLRFHSAPLSVVLSLAFTFGLAFQPGLALRVDAQIAVVPPIATVAGNGTSGYSGDGGPATSAGLWQPRAVVRNSAGDIYITDSLNQVIRKVSATTGTISTVAGNGGQGYSGDGGPATSAELFNPSDIAVDNSGNIYIADEGNNRIREVTASTGIITTIAGNGTAGYSGDGGPATSAELFNPTGIAVDGSGNIYIADYGNNRVREVNAATGIITTVVGNGTAGFSGDGGPATSAELNNPFGVVVDAGGNIYIADFNNNRVREVTASTGIITTIAGNGTAGYSGDGGPATSAELFNPAGIAVDGSGNIYIADYGNNRVREVNAATGIITTVVGNGTAGFSGDGGPATSADLNDPLGVAVDAGDDLYIADTLNDRVREVSPVNGSSTVRFATTPVASSTAQIISINLTAAQSITSITAARSESGAQEYTVGTISGCTADGSTVNAAGTICTVPITFKPAFPGERGVPLTVVTNTGTYKVGLSGIGTGPQVAFTPGTMSTVAGDGTLGYSGDGGPATSAELGEPNGVAVDSAGDIYIVGTNNNVVREVNAQTGDITTIAGGHARSYSGDGGPATAADLGVPIGVAVGPDGSIYIADEGNQRIRKVDAATGIITTVAGDGAQGYSGDGGPATSAELNGPYDVAVDSAGNIYIADTGNSRIRKVNVQTGIITTVAGTGTAGNSGDSGPATSLDLYEPQGVAVDAEGNIYIADSNNNRIREVNAQTGVMTTIAGNGSAGPSGDGGPATAAGVGNPDGVAVDAAGNVYVTSYNNNDVREVNAQTGIISTVAGSGTYGNTGDGGPATSAELREPVGIALDGAGNIYIADVSDDTIQKVNVSAVPTFLFPTPTGIGQTDTADPVQTVAVTNIGNMPLTITSPSTGTNPSYPTNFPVNISATNLCSSTASPLAVGARCNVSANFQPTSTGSNTGTIVLTDNAENVSNTTQTISLSGTGVQTPTITWATPAAITYGTALSATQLDATASVPGTFVYSPTAGTVLSPGTEVLSVTFTPTDTTEYGTTTATVDLTVEQASALVTWATPAAIAYGTALSSTQLDATASVPGTFVYSPAAGTILSGGTQTLSVTFTPTDTTDYSTATATVNLTVSTNPTMTQLSSSLNPSQAGQSVTLSALISTGGATPTGTVTFSNGGTTIGTATVTKITTTNLIPDSDFENSLWTANSTLPIVAGAGQDGSNAIVYTGNGSAAGWTWSASPAITVVPGDTYTLSGYMDASSVTGPVGPVWGVFNTAVSTAYTETMANPGTSGRWSVTFTMPAGVTQVVVIDDTNNMTVANGGKVIFSEPQLEQASSAGPYVQTGTSSVTGSGGLATLTTSALPAGGDVITAAFGGDTNDAASSGTLTQTVTLTTPTVSAWPTASSITYGQSLASSTLTGGTASVAGTFAWTSSTTVPSAVGTQTGSVTFTPANTASYKTVTGTVAVTVAKSSVGVTVSSSLDPSIYGDTVSYTFDFIGASGMALPTGFATIMNGGTTLGTVTINASGEATFSTGILPAGSDTIKAVYGGDANYE